MAISAQHGEGLGELYERLLPFAAPAVNEDAVDAPEARAEKPLQLAIVGRPNVGKSTLVNRLLGEDRVLTGPEPGITRDAIAVEWAWRGRPVRLIDTAGMRRRSRIEARLERLSVADTLRAVRFAETVILVIDALQPLERQDLTIANLVAEEGRPLVLAAAKWDLVKRSQGDAGATCASGSRRRCRSCAASRWCRYPGSPAMGSTALMKAVFAADAVWNRRVPTAALNRWLHAIQEHHPPPVVAGRRLRLRYMTQVNTQAAHLCPVRFPARRTARILPALSGQFSARGFRRCPAPRFA